MTTYSRPGVFVQETLLPLVDPGFSTSSSVAAFVGTASKGGPLGPTLVTSWSQYKSLFGDIANQSDDLGYAVFSFFNNGGAQCYVVRAVKTGATAASLTLQGGDPDGAGSKVAEAVLDVKAKAPGIWAADTVSGVFVTVVAETGGRFDLIVEVGQGTSMVAREQFSDLSLDPADDRNALTIVNSSTVGSNFVTVSLNAAVTAGQVFGTDYTNPVALTATHLTGGSDGSGTADLYAAAQTLNTVNANLSLNLPGCGDTTALTSVITWAIAQGNVFVVVDGPKPSPSDTGATVATALTTMVAALPASSYASVYGPWIYIADPTSRVPGAMRLTAPGGAVLGQYAVSDSTRGVQKPPAGVGTALRGVIDAAVRFDNPTLDTLNGKNVNVIRQVPGSGLCIMGGRTLQVGMPDRYINIRRSLQYLERDLVNLTQFAIFEVNDSDTWDSISSVVSQYLNTQFQLGVLSGDSPDQAFYVVCDDTNNDGTSVNAGIVNLEVGVALNSPAEFIVITIGQFDGGSTVTDTASA